MGRIFAIGDIHGCLKKLSDLIEKIDINPLDDTLVFLGDYIDRGGESFEVVDYLINLKNHFNNIIFLKGNHEQMFEDYLLRINRINFIHNGGYATLSSYMRHKKSRFTHSFNPQIPQEHDEFFKSLVLIYQTKDYIFVHAGLKEDILIEKQNPEDLLWIREEFIHSNYDFGKIVIFGHTPFPRPFIVENKIGIDTGAVYGNKLTCVKLPELDFFQS